jgi:hypothetical protein
MQHLMERFMVYSWLSPADEMVNYIFVLGGSENCTGT